MGNKIPTLNEGETYPRYYFVEDSGGWFSSLQDRSGAHMYAKMFGGTVHKHPDAPHWLDFIYKRRGS